MGFTAYLGLKNKGKSNFFDSCYRFGDIGLMGLYYPPIMENQMEKNMENEMETGGNILFYLVWGGGPRRGPGWSRAYGTLASKVLAFKLALLKNISRILSLGL